MQAEASTSALASRQEHVVQLQEQLQQADSQVAALQQSQASMAADAAAKASKLAHLEGTAASAWSLSSPRLDYVKILLQALLERLLIVK